MVINLDFLRVHHIFFHEETGSSGMNGNNGFITPSQKYNGKKKGNQQQPLHGCNEKRNRALKASSYPYSFILFILQEAEVLFNAALILIQS